MSQGKAAPSSKRRRRDIPQQKTIHGSQIDFQPINEFGPSGLYYYDLATNKAHSLYPSIYSLASGLNGYGYVPLWNFFAEEYYENLGLITFKQLGVWAGLAQLRNRGYRIALTSDRRKPKDAETEVRALDVYLERDYRLLREDLDRLEDALLIHRVRRTDFRGTPDDIIVHTPFTPAALYGEYGTFEGWCDRRKKVSNEGIAGRLRHRVEKSVVKNSRDKKRLTGVTGDTNRRGEPTVAGKNYSFIPRTVDHGHVFTYDRRQIDEAFGQHTTTFADWALSFFRKSFDFLRTDKQAFDRDYRDELKVELDRYGIRANERRELCYRAANKFRQIYCPSIQELLA